MSESPSAQQGRTGVRVNTSGTGQANVSTGVAVFDHLLTQLAAYACFDLALDVEPGDAATEIAGAGRALGQSLAEALEGARGHGSAAIPVQEALAHVTLDRSDRPLVVSNVDFSAEHLGGVGTDLVGRFLRELADGAGLTLHVRLLEGRDTTHVLDAIFKALGVALAQACRTPRKE